MTHPLELRPEALADGVDPADVEQALRQTRALTPVQQQALAYALGYWVLQAAERPADKASVLLLDRVCALAARRAGAAAQDFQVRMTTLRELLENKRQAIGAREAGHRPMQADAVLQLLAAGPRSQAALADQLQLSAGRISQLLAVMEARGLVARQRSGRENEVSLPAGAVPAAPARPAAPALAARVPQRSHLARDIFGGGGGGGDGKAARVPHRVPLRAPHPAARPAAARAPRRRHLL